MDKALERAYELVQKWIINYQESFPPIIINITDAEASDQANTESVAHRLAQLTTKDGNVLILNAQISSGKVNPVFLPRVSTDLPTGNSYANFLFSISSELPPDMLTLASSKGYKVADGSRGFVYNADVETLIQFLAIGTASMHVKWM
jgi:hypothetical protein